VIVYQSNCAIVYLLYINVGIEKGNKNTLFAPDKQVSTFRIGG